MRRSCCSAPEILERSLPEFYASLFASQKQFPQANPEYERGLEVIEKVRSGLINDDSRLTYYNLQIRVLKDYVDLLVSEGHEDVALQVAEYSRSRVLAEKLGLQPGTIRQVRLDSFKKYARQSGPIVLSFWLAPRRSFVWVIKPAMEAAIRCLQCSGPVNTD